MAGTGPAGAAACAPEARRGLAAPAAGRPSTPLPPPPPPPPPRSAVGPALVGGGGERLHAMADAAAAARPAVVTNAYRFLAASEFVKHGASGPRERLSV
eukprot:TRINITY_DN5700_c0_g1_i1.p5 TRINITY_DN5700_c0_g1~~TRINITY_DN5700_c0_g1_i1.p5  ORF type:complete len:114 (-),score=20.48 TRINITY_DN5700_c0_g1_i1:869-1165(-)